MHGLTADEVEILKVLENYGYLKEDQIKKYFKNEKTEKHLGFLYSKGLITRRDGFAALRGVPADPSVIKAFEVLLYYRDEIETHWPATYPFTIYFMRGGKHYDVAVIPPGSETIMCTVINRSYAERVIAVIDSEEQIDEIEIEKPVLFFIPGDPPRLYEKTGTEV
ncbi:MAG: hypothetical protein FIA99_07205 [Ruminiclostridium sp.]|nr:hypothetical protein [Ruminiclostridium sp.]